MTINPDDPRYPGNETSHYVFGVGGAGGNAVNNMITAGLQGRRFRRRQHRCAGAHDVKGRRIIQMGTQVTEASVPVRSPKWDAPWDEVIDEIRDH